uniref:Uncharacterized protein n=1 Tax=Rhizophora mucronata TaxID=61149 RepID=A0A2P2NI74_RHIMU
MVFLRSILLQRRVLFFIFFFICRSGLSNHDMVASSNLIVTMVN